MSASSRPQRYLMTISPLRFPTQIILVDEFRFLLLGESRRGRLLVVSYTERDDMIRIISARIPARREQKDYENR
jgi:uncharacterized DUF497 family protein